jgi:hypothetical protein
MAGQTVCPRCGARDSFFKGYLPETCVCRICQSQLDWREIPGCGPDCSAMGPAAGDEAGAEQPAAEDQDRAVSDADARESRNDG